MAKWLKWDNVDAVGEMLKMIIDWNVKNDNWLTLTVNDKIKAWESHYQ